MRVSAQDAARTASLFLRPGFRVSLASAAAIFAWLALLFGVLATKAAADPVVAAAGDIACSPSSQYFNGGAGTSTKCRQRYTSDLLVNRGLAAVLPLGDEQYDTGKLSSFLKSYDPSWGRVKPITFPAVGNHEYLTSGAAGYFDYFNGVGNFGGRAGDRNKGYYSFDIGTWHIVALNSNCRRIAGGCAPGSPEETWLRNDLATHPARCTLAFWHHPRFSSGGFGDDGQTEPLWQALYDAGADVVLTGHEHFYERFLPLDPTGAPDPARGLVEFTVGTGGKSIVGPRGAQHANSAVLNATTFGVLKLTLHPDGYDWEFVPASADPFRDSGSARCH